MKRIVCLLNILAEIIKEIMPALLVIFITAISVISQNEITYVNSTSAESVIIKWDKNAEPDMLKYIVKVGLSSGEYFSEGVTADTCLQILFPDSLVAEEIFVVVCAVDSAENVSSPSREIVFIPEVVNIDFGYDEKKRIDIDDWRAFLKLYDRFFAKTIWSYTDE